MSQKDSIIQLDFTEEMRNSYRDYAVSVIIFPCVAGCPGRIKTGSTPYLICNDGTRSGSG